MRNLRRFNPVLRSVGVIGVVAGLVTAVTFAATGLTSNTVVLAQNDLETATAKLLIGQANSCPESASTTSTQGMTFTNLVPGVSQGPFHFCLDNTGTIPLTVTTSIPQAAFVGDTGVQPSDVTLDMACVGGTTTHGTLDQYTGGTVIYAAMPINTPTDCTATVTLNASYSGQGNQVVPKFDIDFVGNQ